MTTILLFYSCEFKTKNLSFLAPGCNGFGFGGVTLLSQFPPV